jgi:hypothetical protein
MDVRLLALPPGRFLLLISVRNWVHPRVIVPLEGLGQLKNPMTWSGIEPETFRLVAQCLNPLRYQEVSRLRVLHKKITAVKSKKVKPDCLLQNKSGRIFYGRLWRTKECFTDDDEKLCTFYKKELEQLCFYCHATTFHFNNTTCKWRTFESLVLDCFAQESNSHKTFT